MKPARNAPCPCGSGRRYKSCCLRRDEEDARGRRREAGLRVKEQQAAAAALTLRLELSTEVLRAMAALGLELGAPPYALTEEPEARALLLEWGATGRGWAARLAEGAEPRRRDLLRDLQAGRTALWEVLDQAPGAVRLREHGAQAVEGVLLPPGAPPFTPGHWLVGRVCALRGVPTLRAHPHRLTAEGAAHIAEALAGLPGGAGGLAEGEAAHALLWFADAVARGRSVAEAGDRLALASLRRGPVPGDPSAL